MATTNVTKRQPTMAECDAMLAAHPTWELEEVIINGVREKSWKNQPPYYRVWIYPLLEKWRDLEMVSMPSPKPAPEDAREHWTFGQVTDLAEVYAAFLRSLGVRTGSRVVIAGQNSAKYIASLIATHLLGAVPCFVNNQLVPDLMAYCIYHVSPKVVLLDQECADALVPFYDKIKAEGAGPVYCWDPVSTLVPAARSSVKDIDFTPTPQQLDDIRTGNGLGVEKLTPDSDATIFFTSGTTAKPKAVLSTQRASLHTVVSGTYALARSVLRAGGSVEDVGRPPAQQPVILLPIPLFHVTGGLSWLFKTFTGGAKLVFMRKWSPPVAVKLMQSEGVNVIGGVPAVTTAILQSPDLPKDWVINSLSYGGAPPPERLADDLNKRWPKANLVHGYGMTEVNAVHTAVAGGDYIAKPACVGPPIPICEVRVVDPDTRKDLPKNTVGLVLLKGPNVMKEYVGNPKATAEVLQDGWLDSGDVGELDDDGFLWIRDRSKDIIIRGGENIASLEVESALHLDNRIAEAAVVAVPDDQMGELVGAIVSLAPGAHATEEEIKAAVAPRLRRPARPVIVLISSEPLPINASGKIIKTDCKKVVQAAWKERQQQPKAKL